MLPLTLTVAKKKLSVAGVYYANVLGPAGNAAVWLTAADNNGRCSDLHFSKRAPIVPP